MAPKNGAASTRSTAVKTSLRSISTCTAATVAELQELLSLKTEDAASKVSSTERRPPSRSARAAPTKKTTANTAITTSARDVGSLSARERYILATEVANAALKSLSDALKTQPSRTPPYSKPRPNEDARTPSQSRVPASRDAPGAQKPLQELPVSQTINSTKRTALRRSSSYSSSITTGPDPGLVATAECARLAFAYLRTPEAGKLAGKDTPILQLENGILALVGKLVAHGLDSQAVKELRVLKRRLDIFLGHNPENGSKTVKARPGTKKSPAQAEKETLPSLMDFGDVDRASPALPVIISFQLYALRIIGRIRRPQLVEEASRYLDWSHPSSPANLIADAANSAKPDPKMIRQLESLAQTVVSLCPSVSRTEDAPQKDGRLQPSPEVVLSLQHLAFEIRRKWWQLAGHKTDTEKELLEPFSRCLGAFIRRARISDGKKYELAEPFVRSLLEPTGLLSQTQESGQSKAFLAIAKMLASLAQSANLAEDALRWLKASGTASPADASAAESAARLVQTAALSLNSHLKSAQGKDPRTAMEEALEALSGHLGGTSSEVDNLFLQTNTLRRVATKAISSKADGALSQADLRQFALRIVSATIRFAIRYLDLSNDAGSDVQNETYRQQKIFACRKYASSIVDSACICSKATVVSGVNDHWTTVDALLQDCLAILRHLEESAEEEESPAEELQQAYVKLSNAYWALYLQLRSLERNSQVSMQAMQGSIRILDERPPAEQQSGLLVMKSEKLAEVLESLDQAQGSREATAVCIRALIGSGALESAVALAKTLPVQRVFDADESIAILGRVLKQFHRSFLKFGVLDSSEYAFYDDEALPTAGRGLLLEFQLGFYARLLSKNRSWDADLSASLQAISERLQELYTIEDFPIRRRRVLNILSQLSLEHPDVLPHVSEQITELEAEIDGKGSEDVGLVGFQTHLQTLGRVKSCMQKPTPPVETLKECIATWQNIVESAGPWDSLLERVDDVELWLAELQSLVDFLGAKGEEYVCLPLLRLQSSILELKKDEDPSRLVMSLCAFGLQLLRLGYSGRAGLALAKAEGLALHEKTSTEAKLQWHLDYAEYLVHIGNMAKCESSLAAAQTIAHKDHVFMDLASSSTTLSGRVKFNRILGDACYVHSLLALNTGRHKDAATYAKQCITLNRRVWAALESRAAAVAANTNSSTLDPLSSMRDDKGAPLVMSTTHAALNGPSFWHLIPRLYRGLMQQSQVFAHQGLLQEAVHSAEQAEKIASAVSSWSLTVENSSRRAEYWAQAGKADKAQAALAVAQELLVNKHIYMAGYYSSMARACHLSGNVEGELEAYEKVEGLLEELSSPAYLRSIVASSSTVDSLTAQLSTVSLADTNSAEKVPAKTARARKPAPKKAVKSTAPSTRKPAGKTAKQDPLPTMSIANECSALYSFHADIVRRKALVHLLQEKITTAFQLLDQARILEKTADKSLTHLWVNYKAMLSQSMKQLATDFTFNTLPESTIAFPAVRLRDRRPTEEAVVKQAEALRTVKAKATRVNKVVQGDFVLTLKDARDRLMESHRLCAQIGSSSAFQQASFALAHITVLLSAVSNGELRGSLHPLYVAYMSEIPRNKASQLAQVSIEVEQQSMSREEYLSWPKLKSCEASPLPTTSDFQQDYIDIIPKSWAAVSLSLSEDHDELYITRYESGLSPFVLRLPMGRHTSRDMDEEEFSFDDGKRDFEEIIELNDFSTRTAKDMTSREARLQWWTEREALDARLHELLLNIENIWLGGFKGIFSQHPREASLLARFRKTFKGILDRHLPSRRSNSKSSTTQNKTALDPRVFDLFIGLGDATDETLDLDEALMDLIYFVVDILQFSGESNAYDEVDFDTMVIETTDALKAYHDACQGYADEKRHTILILDKNLHIFPWESLPCLQGLAISRLPSLCALRDRILTARASGTHAVPGHHIAFSGAAGSGGTSILNPSGDLSHTLKTLKPRLDCLPSAKGKGKGKGAWSHITNRPPSEQEFEDALREKDLLLYFGHGSGAQFVRPKAVRKLCAMRKQATTTSSSTAPTSRSTPSAETSTDAMDADEDDDLDLVGDADVSATNCSTPNAPTPNRPTCATALLFGCSSVHLTDNGIYEPSGMLSAYLQAGAPAVVGMLWDVTDKDCDRIAVRMGELWGLWEEMEDSAELRREKGKAKGKGKKGDAVPATPARARSKSRSKATKQNGGKGGERAVGAEKMGLDEAVREAREVCVMRYLNGAAAVVYGIPVYLE